MIERVVRGRVRVKKVRRRWTAAAITLPGHPTSSFNGLYKEPNTFVTQRVIHACHLKFFRSAEAAPALDKEVFTLTHDRNLF